MGRMRPGGLLLEAHEALAGKGVQGVVDRGNGTAQVAGDGGGALAVGTGQQNLAAAHGEGVGGAQSRLQLLLLGSCESANKSRWFHTPLFARSCAQTRPRLPLH